MTYEEAIGYLEGSVKISGGGTSEYEIEVFKKAIDALERAMPKAPVIVMKEFNSYDKVGEPCIIKHQCRTCPTCGSTLMNHGKGWICPNSECRQAIDQDLCEVI